MKAGFLSQGLIYVLFHDTFITVMENLKLKNERLMDTHAHFHG